VFQRRHVDHIPSGNPMCDVNARAFLAEWLLRNLNDNLLPLFKQFRNRRRGGLSGRPTLRAGSGFAMDGSAVAAGGGAGFFVAAVLVEFSISPIRPPRILRASCEVRGACSVRPARDLRRLGSRRARLRRIGSGTYTFDLAGLWSARLQGSSPSVGNKTRLLIGRSAWIFRSLKFFRMDLWVHPWQRLASLGGQTGSIGTS